VCFSERSKESTKRLANAYKKTKEDDWACVNMNKGTNRLQMKGGLTDERGEREIYYFEAMAHYRLTNHIVYN
jgi:hypothetical protein